MQRQTVIPPRVTLVYQRRRPPPPSVPSSLSLPDPPAIPPWIPVLMDAPGDPPISSSSSSRGEEYELSSKARLLPLGEPSYEAQFPQLGLNVKRLSLGDLVDFNPRSDSWMFCIWILGLHPLL